MSKKIQPSEPENYIAVFQETAIRRTWHNEEWWFVVTDVVAILNPFAGYGAASIFQR